MINYTVFGTVDNTTDPRPLTVAAVIEGHITPVDADPGDNPQRQRWAGSFVADSPEEGRQ